MGMLDSVVRLFKAAPKCNPCDVKFPIVRNPAARREFLLKTGFPQGRPGYHVDHKVALACGGKDHWSNMQWLTDSAHRSKTRIDLAALKTARKLCPK
jgi:5-methylcytosine-specific restriction endonuclease McrA